LSFVTGVTETPSTEIVTEVSVQKGIEVGEPEGVRDRVGVVLMDAVLVRVGDPEFEGVNVLDLVGEGVIEGVIL